jgi:hypothetical protein
MEPFVAFSTAALNTFILLTATAAPATIKKESIVAFSWQHCTLLCG